MSDAFAEEELKQSIAQTEAQIERVEALQEAYLATFQTPQGEQVFEDLYGWCRQNKSTYSQGQDVTHTAFLEGRRSVVLRIMQMLNLDDMTIIERARNRALARK